MNVEFTVNGSSVEVDTAPLQRLSRVLREQLGLTGTKVGCDAGDCGACSVLLDNAVVNACTVPIGRLEGATVTTIEGLSRDGALTRLQRSFMHHGAAQCGICTPGMLVAATALLERTSRPTSSQVEDALGGVLCRCTGYRKIIDAVVAAPTFDEAPISAPTGKAVGRRIERVDGERKVAGTDAFGADGAPDEALLIRVVRSPYHRASFTFGDLDGFIATTPGVAAVFTAADVPGANCFGVIGPFADQPVFAERETRFRGEAVAMVVGDAGSIEAMDLAGFPVTWAELEPVLTASDALDGDAPMLHEERTGNVLVRGLVERGRIDDAITSSDTLVRASYTTPFIEHAYIEPEAGWAVRVGDTLELTVTTQTPHMDRSEVASIMGIASDAVVIRPTAVGGGFGSKLDLSVQPYLAIAAWRLEGPVRITYSRPESMMSTTKRHPSRIDVAIGADRDGQLSAMTFDGEFDTGAYASWGPTVANRAPVHAGGPYVYPAYRARTVAVHTNQPPSGAFRGFGVPQSAVAQECAFDELADAVGLDRLEFRRRNALRAGQPTMTGQVFESAVGFSECLDALQPHWDRAIAEAEAANQGHPTRRRGVGVAGMWYGCGNTGLPNPSTIRVGLSRTGRVVLFQGAVDIGQGANTVMAQICADALGVDMGLIDLVGADTDTTPDAGKTSASRQTFISGNATHAAGVALRSQLLALAAIDDDDARIELVSGSLVVHSRGAEHRVELESLQADEYGLVMSAEGTFDPETTGLDERG
jgi:CO/xanthine dehydrogenase Mo-binding subunit/aerobic-type carbon monoxide dehydrogenase small subunit (CoxS/CutS family)